MNLQKAFTFYTKDPSWKLKIFLFILLGLIPAILNFGNKSCLNWSYYICTPLAMGYCALIVHNLINDNCNSLPELDFLKITKTGFKLIAAFISYYAIFIISTIIIAITFVVGGAIFGAMSKNNPELALAGLITLPIFIILGLVIYALFIALTMFLQLTFAENLSFKDCFNFSRISTLMFNNFGRYVLVGLTFLPLLAGQTLFMFLEGIYSNPQVYSITSIIYTAINPFIYFSLYYLFANEYKTSLIKLNNPKATIPQDETICTKTNTAIIIMLLMAGIILVSCLFVFPTVNFAEIGQYK